MSGVAKAVAGAALVAVGFAGGGPIFTSLGASLLLGAAADALAGKPPKPPRQVVEGNVRGSTESHLIVFGERRVGGLLVQLGTSGTDNSLLWIGLAHCVVHPGGCEGLQGLYVDETYLPLATLGALDGSTDVSYTGTGPTPINLAGQLNLAFYRGTGTQNADSASVAAGIDAATAYRRGICWTRMRLRMDADEERFREAYPDGIPTFNAQLRGWRVYDPRLDSTRGGSGSQRADNPLTWTWSRNPALCAATYAIAAVTDGGCGESIAAQNWTSVAAAANICDETITTPSGSQPRFTCDVVLDTGQARRDNLQTLLDSMGGIAPIVSGQRTYFAAAYQTPAITIDDSWLRGPIEDTPAAPLDSIRNRVLATFADATNGWKDTDTPEIAYPSLLDGDGDPLVLKLDLPAVTRPYGAQYLAQIALRRSRSSGTLKLPLNLRGLDVFCGETVAVTLPELGLNAAVYRVQEWRWDGLPVVVLRAETASDYTAGPFISPAALASVGGGSSTPGAPTSFIAQGLTNGVALNWRNAAGTTGGDPLVSTYAIERVVTLGTAWAEIARTPALNYLDVTAALDQVYDYRVRAISVFGLPGTASATATGSAIRADAISNVPQNASFENGGAGWTFGAGWAVQRQSTTGGGSPTITFPARTGLFSARRSGAGTSSAVSDSVLAVSPGNRVSAASYWYRDDTGTAGNGRSVLRWLQANGATIGSPEYGPLVDGTVSGSGGGAFPVSQWEASLISNAVAPLGAAFVRLELEATNTIRVDDCALTRAPDNTLDDLPDGLYAKVDGSYLTPDGFIKLGVAGQSTLPARNIPPTRLASVGALWSGLGSGITATYDGASPANVTISFSSQSLRFGSSVTFSASSVTVTQARGTSQMYNLYYDGGSSAVLDGGTQTLAVSTNAINLVDSPNRISIGRITVAVGSTPGTGGTGGPGSPGGGGGYVSY